MVSTHSFQVCPSGQPVNEKGLSQWKGMAPFRNGTDNPYRLC